MVVAEVPLVETTLCASLPVCRRTFPGNPLLRSEFTNIANALDTFLFCSRGHEKARLMPLPPFAH